MIGFFLLSLVCSRSLAFECPPSPAPIFNLTGISFYVDSRHSIISPARFAKWVATSTPMNDFVESVATMARFNASVSEHQCAARWLVDWARAGALARVNNGQAEMLRQWSVSGLSLAYLRMCAHIDAPSRRLITDWLAGRALPVTSLWTVQVSTKNSTRVKGMNRNNHYYWHGLSALAAGVAAGDDRLISFARSVFIEALEHILPNGSLPGEARRGQRALYYHAYALQPILMMAEVARFLSEDWYEIDKVRLAALIRLTVTGLRSPKVFVELSGVPEEAIEYPSANMFSWCFLLPWTGLASDVFPLDDLTAKINSAFVFRLGGDLAAYAQHRFEAPVCQHE